MSFTKHMDALTIDIRPAEPDDTWQVAQTHRLSWEGAYNGMLPHKSLREMFERRNANWWERAIKGSANVLVLDVGNVIAGYTTLGVNRVKELSQQGEIYELYLRPEFQGVGLGQKLFTESRRFLNSLGHQGCVVWSLDDNLGAKQFYKAMGGQKVAAGHETFDGKRFAKIAYGWS
jgi:ribosomal protein S18 acetylase RimI-like enzyme